MIVYVLRILLRFFHFFPLSENRIVFSSFEGRQYSDNPKYLFLYIKSRCADKYEYVWVLNKEQLDIDDVKIVRFLSIKHIYYLLTSKFIISNLGIEPFIPKRKEQVIVNTWHGTGAYKTEILGSKEIPLTAYKKNMRDYRSKITDYYISGCRKFIDVYTETWNVSRKKFLVTGTPRNDILFLKDIKSKREEILRRMGLKQDVGYILYAPTFRGISFRKHKSLDLSLDFARILCAVEKKFKKKFVFLYREHIGFCGNLYNSSSVLNVSNYSDMQELLIISDLFITDYSSCLWDFSILNRPGFIFAPDLEEYLNNRGFYTPIEKWPYKLAQTNDELIHLIEKFDEEENISRIKEHFLLLGSFENGESCKDIVEQVGII